MTTEQAGQTADAYLCRWGCGNGQSWATRRDGHEKNKHGALFGGPLAHEVNKHRTEAARLFAMLNERADEADALRTALDTLTQKASDAIDDARRIAPCPLCRVDECECWTPLADAIASAEAALKGAAK